MEQGGDSTGWHPEDIKAALRKRGWTIARIGREMGYAFPDTPRKVFVQPWPYMEQVVADLLHIHPAEIWPDRYKADGTHKGAGIRKHSSIFPKPGKEKRGDLITTGLEVG